MFRGHINFNVQAKISDAQISNDVDRANPVSAIGGTLASDEPIFTAELLIRLKRKSSKAADIPVKNRLLSIFKILFYRQLGETYNHYKNTRLVII